MRKDSEKRRFLQRVIGPTLASGAPKLQKVAQGGAGDEDNGHFPLIGRGQDEEDAQDHRHAGEGFGKRGGGKRQQQSQEGGEDQSINAAQDGRRERREARCRPQPPQEPIAAARQAVGGKGGDGPGRDNP